MKKLFALLVIVAFALMGCSNLPPSDTFILDNFKDLKTSGAIETGIITRHGMVNKGDCNDEGCNLCQAGEDYASGLLKRKAIALAGLFPSISNIYVDYDDSVTQTKATADPSINEGFTPKGYGSKALYNTFISDIGNSDTQSRLRLWIMRLGAKPGQEPGFQAAYKYLLDSDDWRKVGGHTCPESIDSDNGYTYLIAYRSDSNGNVYICGITNQNANNCSQSEP